MKISTLSWYWLMMKRNKLLFIVIWWCLLHSVVLFGVVLILIFFFLFVWFYKLRSVVGVVVFVNLNLFIKLKVVPWEGGGDNFCKLHIFKAYQYFGMLLVCSLVLADNAILLKTAFRYHKILIKPRFNEFLIYITFFNL